MQCKTAKMKLKRALAIFGSVLIVFVIFIIYSAKDLSSFSIKKSISEEFQDVCYFKFDNYAE